MKAKDIMVTNVITIDPEASVQEVAATLLNNRISALPVVDKEGSLIGIVSEGDLVRRAELETDYRNSWWLKFFATKNKKALAAQFVKAHGLRVEDVMTRNVITARPGTSVRDIAMLLERNHVKRVPIVVKGKVVGIVSRANLIQGLASLPKEREQTGASESTIRKSIMAKLKSERWSKGTLLNVTVENGVVQLWGIVGSQEQKQAARVAAELVAGVQKIENNLVVLPVGTEN